MSLNLNMKFYFVAIYFGVEALACDTGRRADGYKEYKLGPTLI